MASRTMALVIAAGLCGGCGSTTDVTLQLTDTNNDCFDEIPSIKTLSIEAVANNGACRIKHECAFDVRATTVDGLEAALRASADILVELDPGDAQVLKVNGRKLDDCFPNPSLNDPIVCGNANLDAIANGELVVELQAGDCVESVPLCP